jgi:hypothetical protein
MLDSLRVSIRPAVLGNGGGGVVVVVAVVVVVVVVVVVGVGVNVAVVVVSVIVAAVDCRLGRSSSTSECSCGIDRWKFCVFFHASCCPEVSHSVYSTFTTALAEGRDPWRQTGLESQHPQPTHNKATTKPQPTRLESHFKTTTTRRIAALCILHP